MKKTTLPIALLLLLAAQSLYAESTEEDTLVFIGADLFSEPVEVLLEEDTAYVLYPSGLHQVVLLGPSDHITLASFDLPGADGYLAKKDSVLYISRGESGILLIGFGESEDPIRLDTIPAPSSFGPIAIGRDRLYAADRDSGVVVYDLSLPAFPARVGLYGGEGISDLLVRGGVAFLAKGRAGVTLLDITDPVPSLLVELDGMDDALRLALGEDYLVVGRGDYVLTAVDVSDSSAPVVLPNEYVSTDSLGDLVAIDSFVVAIVGGEDLVLLRSADLGGGVVASSAGDSALTRVTEAGGKIYVTTEENGVRETNVARPQSAIFIAKESFARTSVSTISLSGDTAYLAAFQMGVMVASVATPADPDSIGRIPTVNYARDCEPYGDYLFVAEHNAGVRVYSRDDGTMAAFLPLPGIPQRIARQGTILYVSSGTEGVYVVDISSPTFPVVVDSVEPAAEGGTINAVSLRGDEMVTAEGTGGVRLFDLSDPAHPVELGSYVPGGSVAFAALSDSNRIYATVLARGIVVIDKTNPSSLDSTGFLSIAAPVLAASAFSGEVLYQLEGAFYPSRGKLHVVSLSDPDAPRIARTLESTGIPSSLILQGSWAYVAASQGGLEVYGTYDDYGFSYLDEYRPYPHVTVVAASETRTLAADEGGRVWPFYVQEGSILGRGDPYDFGTAVVDIALGEKTAFVALEGETRVAQVDVTIPGEVNFVRWAEMAGEASGFFYADSLLYVALGPSGLGIYDISDPDTAAWVGGFASGGTAESNLVADEAYRVVVEDGTAYVVTQNTDRSLYILDVSDPVSPSFLSSATVDRRVFDVAVYQKYVYLAARVHGCAVLDARDPTEPLWLTAIPELRSAREFDTVEGKLFGSQGPDGVVVLDLATPTNPLITFWEDTPGQVLDLALMGPQMAVADRSSLRMYKQNFAYADEQAPTYAVGILPNPFANAYVEFVIVASEALVERPEIRFTMGEIDSLLDVRRLDVPRNVYGAAYRLTETGGGNVAVSGEDLSGNKSEASKSFFVSYIRSARGGSIYDGTGKLRITIPPRSGDGESYVLLAAVEDWELGESTEEKPASLAGPFRIALGDVNGPVTVRMVDLPPNEEGVHPSLYCWNGSSWDRLASEYDAAAKAVEGTLPGSSVFLFSYEGGGEVPPAPTVRMERNRPNPFNPETTILLHLSTAAPVRLAVYDITGRLVRTLVDGPLPAGTSAIRWDGRNDGGRSVGSGVYLSRLEALGMVRTGKLLLLR